MIEKRDLTARVAEWPPEKRLLFALRAELSLQALRNAATAVVERHPILRTSFDLTSYSQPLQLVDTASIAKERQE